jgi:hypothetical protein
MQVLRMLLSADLMPNVVTLNALLSAVVSAGVSGNERSEEQVLTLLALLVQNYYPKKKVQILTELASRCFTDASCSCFTHALLTLY